MILLFLAVSLTGCARSTIIKYYPIPEVLLEECEYGKVPTTNGELMDAWARAVACAKRGNKDKSDIRSLIEDAED